MTRSLLPLVLCAVSRLSSKRPRDPTKFESRTGLPLSPRGFACRRTIVSPGLPRCSPLRPEPQEYWFSVFGDAKSADGSIELQLLPQYTWQFVDDPQAQRHVQEENQRATRVGMKPCPLRTPIHAADFLRQDLLAKYRNGKTIVSIEPFPRAAPPSNSATSTTLHGSTARTNT
jgi:hypothetical protein